MKRFKDMLVGKVGLTTLGIRTSRKMQVKVIYYPTRRSHARFKV
jgi:hypothetical protein